MASPGGIDSIIDSMIFHRSSTSISSTLSTSTTSASSTATASSTTPAAASSSTTLASVSAPTLAISVSVLGSAQTDSVAPNSFSSSTVCDTNCIIAISTVLGGVLLILGLAGIAYFTLMRRRRRTAAATRNWPLAANGAEEGEKATGPPATADTDIEPQIGIVRRATDLANAVKDKLPGRSGGTERGRPGRVEYERAPSRSVSRADDAGRPSRGLGWAI